MTLKNLLRCCLFCSSNWPLVSLCLERKGQFDQNIKILLNLRKEEMKNLAICFFNKRFCNGKLRQTHYPSSTLRQILLFQTLSSLRCTYVTFLFKQGAHLSHACVWTWEAWRSTSCCAGCNTPQCWGSWVHLGRPPRKDGRQGRLHRTAVYAHSWWLPVSTCPDAGSTARCLSHLENNGEAFQTKLRHLQCSTFALLSHGVWCLRWLTEQRFFYFLCILWWTQPQDTELELEHSVTNHWGYFKHSHHMITTEFYMSWVY